MNPGLVTSLGHIVSLKLKIRTFCSKDFLVVILCCTDSKSQQYNIETSGVPGDEVMVFVLGVCDKALSVSRRYMYRTYSG